MYTAVNDPTSPARGGEAAQAADMIEQASASSRHITKDDDRAKCRAYRELRPMVQGSSASEGNPL